MGQAVLQTDGLVELMAPDPRLAAYEGVRALLHDQRLASWHICHISSVYAPQPRTP